MPDASGGDYYLWAVLPRLTPASSLAPGRTRGWKVPGILGSKDVGQASETDRQAAILGARAQMGTQREQIDHAGRIRMGDPRDERTDRVDGATIQEPGHYRHSDRMGKMPATHD
jgi:hypothetical protein